MSSEDATTLPSLAETELQGLAARFESAEIPKQEWTHAAHLAIGLWHVHRYGREEALSRLRTGIRRLNDAHCTLNTPSGGYHETVTRAYVELFADLLAGGLTGRSLADTLRIILDGPLGARHVLLRHYSRERLFSPEARASWLEPDLRPLAAADHR